MNGLLFFWVGWMIWIVITFLMDKSPTRTYLCCSLLMIMFVSDYWLTIRGLEFNYAVILLIFCTTVYLAKSQNWLVYFFRTFCLLLGYVGILFWEQVSPVWMFLPRVIMIPLVGILLLLILSGSLIEKTIIWSLGLACGEVLHGLILRSYGFSPRIGEFAFLDLVFVGLGMLLIIQGLYEVKVRIDHLIQLVEKQKKRWTHE